MSPRDLHACAYAQARRNNPSRVAAHLMGHVRARVYMCVYMGFLSRECASDGSKVCQFSARGRVARDSLWLVWLISFLELCKD